MQLSMNDNAPMLVHASAFARHVTYPGRQAVDAPTLQVVVQQTPVGLAFDGAGTHQAGAILITFTLTVNLQYRDRCRQVVTISQLPSRSWTAGVEAWESAWWSHWAMFTGDPGSQNVK